MIARMEDRPGPVARMPAPRAGPAEGVQYDENKTGTYLTGNAEESLPLATGIAGIDAVFAHRGLAGNALHEIHAPQARSAGAATGFVAGLLARLGRSDSAFRPVLWVQDPASAQEAGRLHAPGLHEFGLDPRRVITLAVRSMTQVLWALEEGLDCPGLGAVVGDMRGPSRALTLTATRRLALRAEKARRPVLFLKTEAPEEASAARSRWRILPAPSAPLGGYRKGLGRAAWRLELVKNRDGATGAWTLEWNHHDQCFLVAAAGAGALAAAPADRPAGARRLGAVVALERAS